MARKEHGRAPAIRWREVELETDGRGRRDNSVAIAFSSETPVERQDWATGQIYQEVLSHDPADVNLTRARSGLPFLMDHNVGTQLGLIEDVTLGMDRKLRGVVRWGNHPDSGWVAEDLRDGIRKKSRWGMSRRHIPPSRARTAFPLASTHGRRWRSPALLSRPTIPSVLGAVTRNEDIMGGSSEGRGFVGENPLRERMARLGFIAQVAHREADLPGWLSGDRSVRKSRPKCARAWSRTRYGKPLSCGRAGTSSSAPARNGATPSPGRSWPRRRATGATPASSASAATPSVKSWAASAPRASPSRGTCGSGPRWSATWPAPARWAGRACRRPSWPT